MALNLVDNCTISANNVVIKFGRTIPVSSLLDENFELYEDSATPVQINSPFRDISTITDYNQISRTLNLYWNTVLKPDTDYKIKLVNIVDATGTLIASEEITFTSAIESATPSSLQTVVTQIEELLIEDKSIRTDVETSYQIIAKNPEFYVNEVSPANGDFYIDNGENDGRVVVSFNERPASNFLTTKYFKAQRKKIQKAPSRWETLPAQISMHSWKPDVYVDFPSSDATPAYYVDDKIYFEAGYKYRVIISSEVGI